MHAEGVRHRGTRQALQYLLRHETGLRRYCEDGRLPISNIASEHVAKTIAVPRKNFLFADTPGGAAASARIYSLIETARANGHEPRRYLTTESAYRVIYRVEREEVRVIVIDVNAHDYRRP